MKYTLERSQPSPQPERLSLQQFALRHGLTMRVTKRSDGAYLAHFDRVETKRNGGLLGEWGAGSTPEAAIGDYADRIAGQLLIWRAWQPERREIRAPATWAVDEETWEAD